MNKKTLLLILMVSVVAFSVVTPVYAQKLTEMTDRVKTVAVQIGGSIVVIGWVVAGILWLISGGSPEKTGVAKKAILACVIGTILVILASGDAISNVIKDAFNLT